MNIIKKLIENHELTKEEYIKLLDMVDNPAVVEALKGAAVRLKKEHYGNKVYTRGLIEFTNYCKNGCYYCGINRENREAKRYRLSREEILSCCENGYELGFRTFVLQGGEDPYFTDDRMVELIREIKEKYSDCALTLSIGEKSYESYRAFREAGADRYLLRHETASEELYRKLHPEEMKLSSRKECLYQLKELGYQVGAGFMVGSPGQAIEHLAEDLLFLKELKPQMVGIGPFIPHHDTRFAGEKAGSVEMTLFLLSIIRILLPKVLLPATTALGTLDPRGREKGLCAGANVVMPNLSPVKNRKLYDLYDNKICTGEEAAECRGCLSRRVESVGYQLVCERGDAI
ncbi:[FeFe] hydrogenase H-cluster radical SAM maturase HydE [Acetivibrio ethanolgignens]|uniref:[FeFe] hydrogenase H-cluster radical SAM maturase HydE n=1 Tax=Acetivibrio ethanolgignens TaxID=290052 RepID=A0A0V8QE02_9FIRM|nr:[FeFe] hydrogenase H-cluster radical SAM maturase HydE [Acetivibrio ethanolgignens]KSV58638.1 [FeFe] hydrogenase H-cluster radical SAM maturase HydE [Acetivibrio ethanolgignens]